MVCRAGLAGGVCLYAFLFRFARTRGSDYPSILPFFKEKKIGCFSYGLVNGKQQCQYPWNPVENGELVPFTEEPDVWFHDLFRPDGTPYSEEEVRFIKEMTVTR